MEKLEIADIFPELSEIEDSLLRESCKNTWLEGVRQGGWTKEELCKLPFVIKELVNCPVTLVAHVRSVIATAKLIQQQFADAYGEYMLANRDTVIAGALLHDVGKLLEYEKQNIGYSYTPQAELRRHPLAGAILAERCGVPDEVVHIIATHSFEGSQSHRTLESFIVRNADWLNFDYLSMKYPSTMSHK